MGNKKFDKIKKTLAILLVLCFVLSVTAAAASAAKNSENGKDKDGYKDGYDKGYNDGKIQGQKDCRQHGVRDIPQKIPNPHTEDRWTKDFKGRYKEAYKLGFINGYSQSRYKCFKE